MMVHGGNRVNWGTEDIAAAAVLLLVAVVAVALILKAVHSRTWRLLLTGLVVLVVLAVWAQLAVGIL
jgi:hypothetical protein